ncbi:MAG: zinc-binding dehydrogenase [Phototrophicaceae bacterium]
MLPETYKKIIVTQRGKDPHQCLKVVEVPLSQPHTHDILVKNHYAGVNALDIGRMMGLDVHHPTPPFDFGIEAVGEVMAVGQRVKDYKVGDTVVTVLPSNGFREYSIIDHNFAGKVPGLDPKYVGVYIGGTTAKIALEFIADIQVNETVMVTSALGESGHFAVQLAKLQGCHVVGTCANDAEAAILKQIGVDRIIIRDKEDVAQVLHDEYSHMLNVVYDTIGGEILDACIDNTAPRARIILANALHEQLRGAAMTHSIDLYHKIIRRSVSLIGMNLNDYANAVPLEGLKLIDKIQLGEIQSIVDPHLFTGIESVPDALAHLISGQARGKVVVKL